MGGFFFFFSDELKGIMCGFIINRKSKVWIIVSCNFRGFIYLVFGNLLIVFILLFVLDYNIF